MRSRYETSLDVKRLLLVLLKKRSSVRSHMHSWLPRCVAFARMRALLAVRNRNRRDLFCSIGLQCAKTHSPMQACSTCHAIVDAVSGVYICSKHAALVYEDDQDGVLARRVVHVRDARHETCGRRPFGLERPVLSSTMADNI
jgi:hypothetical protein